MFLYLFFYYVLKCTPLKTGTWWVRKTKKIHASKYKNMNTYYKHTCFFFDWPQYYAISENLEKENVITRTMIKMLCSAFIFIA